MFTFIQIFLFCWTSIQILSGGLTFAQGHGGRFADIQGRYCETRVGGCCPGRQDDCHTPILDHLCYCDDFCDGDEKTYRENHDCCPDYFYECQGAPRPLPPPQNLTAVCYHEGTPHPSGSSRKNNCNECKCEHGSSGSGTWMCEEKECLIDPQLIDILNRGDYSWRASNYTDFWGRDLSDGITYRLGTLLPENAVYNMKPVRQIYEPSSLPASFDARQNRNWSNYIQPVSDQGWCGSDWAVTTVAVTADRLAIQSKGAEIAKLSAQHLLSCDNGQLGCQGGHLDRAWNFMRAIGIVDEDCYPYLSGLTGMAMPCLMSRRASLHDCKSSNPPGNRTDVYKTGPAYRISQNEDDIKYEILTYGPVQAVMEVSPDFFMYRSGVYRKVNLRPASRVGFHSVRILGWGEESHRRGQTIKYWIVANSWGSAWGESGTFRILRGENECDIEKFVIAAWARPDNEKTLSSQKELRTLSALKRFAKWGKI